MLVLYRLLLLAYPAALRRDYGDDMTAAVRLAWQDAAGRGWRARARMAARLINDWLVSLAPAWRGRRPQRPHSPKDPMLTTSFRELRLAARALWIARGSTLAIVVTLALAIGATAAVFSVVNAVVLRPLPFAGADRLVAVWEHNIVRNQRRNVVAPANFHEWRDRAQSFDQMAAIIDTEAALIGMGPAEQISVAYGSWNLFDMLGVRPAHGESFRESDSGPASARKGLLSWEFWQRRFNGDPAVIGRTLQLSDERVEVVGVLPASFRLAGHRADVWWQVRYSAAQRVPRGRSWQVIARLKPDVSVEQARAEMNTIAGQLEAKYPAFDTGWRVTVNSLRDDLSGSARTPLLLMLGAVAILLLIGCANTTNLLLAKASARRRDMAVRTALGATRWHLARQLLAEGALLAALGVLAGLGLAKSALVALARFGDRLGIPRLDEAALDSSVLLLSLVVMTGCALLFSLLPVSAAGQPAVSGALAGGGRWSTGHRRDRKTRHLLVVTQVAGAVVLVIGAGLVTRSLMQLVSVDPGFDRSVFTFSVSVPSAKYDTPARMMRLYDEVVTQVRATPGITSAGYMGFLPFTGPGTATGFTRADAPPPPAGQEPVADIRPVDAAYFSTMGVRLLKGRGFTADEVRSGQRVCVISATTAAAIFGAEDPLGKWLKIELGSTEPDQIIGVVSDVHHLSLSEPSRPMIYYPFGTFPLGFMSVVMRGSLDDASMRGAATRIVQELDRDIPVTDAVRMQSLISDSVASPAAAAQLVAAFGVLALVLSLVGVAALLAALVAGRTTEFGVRLAMGATPGDIRRLVLRQGAWLIGCGLAIGGTVAVAGSRALAAELYAVRPLEPVIYAGALGLVALLGLIAADVPARRATRVNPVDTLR
jgi:putative ABC transport system permease protein